MLFEISTDGRSLRVPGNNWLEALGGSLSEFGLDSSVLGRLIVDVGSDGVVQVKDPVSGSMFVLKALEGTSDVDLGHGEYETSAADLPTPASPDSGARDAARGSATIPPPPAEAESDRPEDLVSGLYG